MTLAPAALLAAAAFLAGSVNAVGGGGSLISFPTLLGLGYPAVTANVTNAVALSPGYLGSVVSYRREIFVQRELALELGLVAVAGGVIGAALLLVAPPHVFVVLAPYLMLGACLQLALGDRLASRDRTERSGRRGGRWGILVGVFVSAVYGAYFGAGLGIMLLALLGIFLPDGLQRLNALKIWLSLVINLIALGTFAVFGPVAWPAVLIMAIASLAGGWIGGRLAKQVPDWVLRVGVIGFGMIGAATLVIRG